MTGFGAAEGTVGSARVTVELRSVNHRFFNATIKLPAELSRWEGEVREALRKRLSRGHITLNARVDRGVAGPPLIDEEREQFDKGDAGVAVVKSVHSGE